MDCQTAEPSGVARKQTGVSHHISRGAFCDVDDHQGKATGKTTQRSTVRTTTTYNGITKNKRRKPRMSADPPLPKGHQLFRKLQVGPYDNAVGRPNHADVAAEHNTTRNNVCKTVRNELKRIFGHKKGEDYWQLYKSGQKEMQRVSPKKKSSSKKSTAPNKKKTPAPWDEEDDEESEEEAMDDDSEGEMEEEVKEGGLEEDEGDEVEGHKGDETEEDMGTKMDVDNEDDLKEGHGDGGNKDEQGRPNNEQKASIESPGSAITAASNFNGPDEFLDTDDESTMMADDYIQEYLATRDPQGEPIDYWAVFYGTPQWAGPNGTSWYSS